MSRIAPLAAVLALAAVSAQADIASDFAALKKALPLFPVETRSDTPIADAKALIAGMAGDWIPVSILAAGYALPPEDILASACAKLVYRLTPEGELGMRIEQGRETDMSLTRLLYLGNGVFAALPDEASFMRRLFGDDMSTMAETTRMMALANHAASINEVTILPSGENLLLFMPHRGRAEIWGRCP
jgi:hypothetical protein